MPTWRSGETATLTNGSAAVTGAGTTWLSAAPVVYAGYALVDDAGTLHEIAAISGDTTLELVENYAGVTGSKTISIVPVSRAGIEATINRFFQTLLEIGDVGRTIHTVAGAPSDVLGKDGDFAIDPAALVFYAKSAGTWSAGVSMASGLKVLGVLANTGDLPGTATAGDTYIISGNYHVWDDTAAAFIDVGPVQGADGADGADGAVWRNGTGAPADVLGVNGDFYLDGATGNVYKKASGTYSVVANIKGVDGADGPAGTSLVALDVVADFASLPGGASVGDAYITDDNGHLYLWNGSAWADAGAHVGPTGATGATGAAGADGKTVLYGTAAPTTEGVDGDFYIRTSTNFIYGPKAAGAWPAGTSLVGPQGPTGATGATGATGDTGPAGADGADGVTNGYNFTFSTTITDADPGAGVVRFNHATFGSVTSLFVDNADAAAGDVTAWLDSLDDSTTANHKGYLRVIKATNPAVYREFVVTGAVVDGTGYRKIPVSPVAVAGALADTDAVFLLFSRTGNQGAAGAGSGDMLAATYDPGAVAGNAFDMDNMVEGTTTKILTSAERNKLAAIEAEATADQTGAEIKALYEAEADTNAFSDAQAAKVNFLMVTAGVDLDQLKADMALFINGGMIFKDDWDASSGSFPGGGVAQAGWQYYVSTGGTVDSVEFSAGDTIVARVDNASTTTYSPNWRKHDQTDAVQAVVGLTGSISQAALLAALGLATTDSPQFAGVNIGHATDTTVARIAAGRLSIEGDEIAKLTAVQTLTNKAFQAGSIDGATVTGVREALTGNRTYYVRSDGSDSNDGQTNNSGGAFLTLQAAFDALASLDGGLHAVTIQIADATYTERTTISAPWLGCSEVNIQGNSGTPSNVVLSTAGHNLLFSAPLPCPVRIKDLELRTSSGDAIRIETPGVKVFYSNLVFGDIAGTGIHCFAPGSMVQCNGDYEINGDCATHLGLEYNAFCRCDGKTITLTGTPNFSNAFVNADTGAGVLLGGNTYSGSATGKRYNASYNGFIKSETTLPGNSAGTESTGGVYV